MEMPAATSKRTATNGSAIAGWRQPLLTKSLRTAVRPLWSREIESGFTDAKSLPQQTLNIAAPTHDVKNQHIFGFNAIDDDMGAHGKTP